MRIAITAVLALAALWFAWIDWQETIGQGYAYRLTGIGPALAEYLPGLHDRLVTGWQEIGLLWSPVGSTLMSLPLALVLGVGAALLWVTRPRGRRA